MPSATPENRCEEHQLLKKRILQNINNISELATICKSLKDKANLPMEDKVDLMLVVFTTESKTPKYDLMTFLWNFLKILYNEMNKLILKLIPAIAIDRSTELAEKHVILCKEITTRLYFVMVYMKDTSTENTEIICRNVLLLSKCLVKQGNYTEFLSLAKDSFFNPKHFFQIKLFASPAPAHDLFLEHYLTRLWEFRDFTEDSLKDKGLNAGELFEKFFQIFLCYVNYEAKLGTSCKYPLTDKLISVLLNLTLAKSDKAISNAIKCLYSVVQLMKDDTVKGQDMASKLLHQYMARICDKSCLNSSPYAADTLATIAVLLERNPYFVEEKNLACLSLESVRYLLLTIKLTVGLTVEPVKGVCEMKDCVKGVKKHTITSLTRFAQKLFVGYVAKLKDPELIDVEILATVTQLVIFHFHVLERLNCSSRVANEHNDVRRLYSTFSQRSKVNVPSNVVHIFEIVLKYTLQRNLSVLVSPLAMLLTKYYTEADDQVNCDRIEWLNLICRHNGDGAQSATAFDNCSYNWAVKKQKLTKEEMMPILQTMRDTKFDYHTEMIPQKKDSWREVFLRILESIAVLNLKAFRVLQECLVELMLAQSSNCSKEEVVTLLFYATESQIVSFKEVVQRNREHFETSKSEVLSNGVALAVLHSLEYQVYVAELRQELKTVDMNVLQSREVKLTGLTLQRDNQQLENLRRSLEQLRRMEKRVGGMTAGQRRQAMGTLKRNIRYCQLAGLEMEEVSACQLLYAWSKESKDVEGALLAMANLMNHVHFIIKDEKCRNAFPTLVQLINGEGSNLLRTHLTTIKEAKESIQVLIVFGVGNMIKLNADLGRRERCYEYLHALRQKIDEIKPQPQPSTTEEQTTSVNELQYNLISFQLFLKYAPESKVNPLMVARKLFSAVRQLHKVSDLYALYLYDVLVELFCFSVPRYETKGLDFFICTVLKYFIGVGSVTRIVDILLIYANWALCCENLDKCAPVMEYVAEILGTSGSKREEEEAGVVKLDPEEQQQRFTRKVSQAIVSINGSADSVWLAIVAFKLNCLLARKCFIDRCYEQARKRYEDAWHAYEGLNDRIANYSLKMEFQQFYVNALFQLSNVYHKLGMPTKSFHFCEQTMVMISDILVNRLALTQEAYFQELAFKPSSLSSSISPIRMEMAVLMNEKKVAKSSKKRLPASKEETTTPAQSRRAKANSKTPAKPAKIKVETTPDGFLIPTSLPVVVVAVDENSSVLGNQIILPDAEETKRKTTARKIPVRSTATRTSAKEVTSTTTTTTVKSGSTTLLVTAKKRTTATLVITEQASTIAATAPTPVASSTSTRKTSRRLL